jgi:adenylate cyclase
MKSRFVFFRSHAAPSVIAFGLALMLARLEFVDRFENVTVDRRTTWRARFQPDYAPLPLVVGIDDPSIEDSRFGRWPWRRVLHGEFLGLAGRGKASVVGWDTLFVDPDTIEPINDAKLLAGAVAARNAGTEVVFGAVTNETPGTSVLQPLTPPVTLFEGDIQRLLGEKALLPPLPDLQEVAHFGTVDTPPGADGSRRRVPLVVRAGDQAYLSLSLQTVLRHWKVPVEKIRVRLGDGIYVPTAEGERRIPIDANGLYHVNYRFGSTKLPVIVSFRILAWGLAGNLVRDEKFENVPDIAGRILLVGLVATALTDNGPTPFSGHTPLVLVHANVVDNILRQDFARQAPTLWVWLGGVAISMGGLALFSKRRLSVQGAFALGVPLLYGLLALYVWVKYSVLFPLVWPLLGFATVQIFMISRRLILEQRAKAKITGMFGTYLSPALVKRMIDSGQEPKLGGHEEAITAYFSDIQGFSSFSEKLPPERLVELMNEYLTACTDIVQEEGGTLDKYIGDAVVAMFGAPIALPDHAYRACVAAQRIHQKLGELRDKWKAEGDKWPEIVWKMQSRIGLNSGSCIIGNMGSRTRFNYTMMGDNVNLAARMESGAKAWGVYSMCTDATKAACEAHGDDRVIFRPLGRIVVVGRSVPVPIFEIVGLKESLAPATRECLQTFNAALEKYYARDWPGAIAGFQQSAELEPNQPGKTPGVKNNPSLVYLDIVDECLTTPPPEPWDGVRHMTEK